MTKSSNPEPPKFLKTRNVRYFAFKNQIKKKILIVKCPDPNGNVNKPTIAAKQEEQQ